MWRESIRPALRYCRTVATPPPILTSLLPAAFFARTSASSNPPVTKWKAVPPSAYSDLSPSLLACLDHFIQVGNWTYLEKRPILQSRMLRHELNSVIHVA